MPKKCAPADAETWRNPVNPFAARDQDQATFENTGHPESGDDGRDSAISDQSAICHADQTTRQNRDREDNPQGNSRGRELSGDTDANAGGRTDRNVDMAAKNNHRHSDHGHRDVGRVVKNIDQVARRNKTRIQKGYPDQHQDEGDSQNHLLMVEKSEQLIGFSGYERIRRHRIGQGLLWSDRGHKW